MDIIIPHMNNVRLTCILFLNIIPLVIGIKCYVCDGCPSKMNLTADSIYIKSGCVRCLTTTEIEDTEKSMSVSNRRCLTETIDEYLKLIGINPDEGCSNVSQIPDVTKMKYICFCSTDLCNFSFNHSSNMMWICFLVIVYLLFQYA